MIDSADTPRKRGLSAEFAKYGPRFSEAIRRFDAENGNDPNLLMVNGVAHPQELLYSERLTSWILRLAPEASEHLLLAARSQHIRRWTVPRASYEMTRAGYLKWRADLKQFHAAQSAKILGELGYDEATIKRVRDLNLKKLLGRDADSQILEDALCLVTLQYQLADLMAKTEPSKMIEILRKTWKKMSQTARDHALALTYADSEKRLIEQALSGAG
jgi:hypothetical protein